MLFPQLGPPYLDESGRHILQRMEAFYAESVTINQSYWGEADTDTRFFVGDQSLWNDMYGNLPANRRKQFSFNRIMRVINMISGFQRRNRKSTICMPIENASDVTADQFSKIFMWNTQQEDILETISEAFYQSLVTGMGFLQVWSDYRQDPISGNLKVDYCPYNSVIVDPYFKKKDMSDCNGIWKRSFLTKRECISLLPEFSKEIEGLSGNPENARDGKFQFLPENYNYGPRNLLSYDEFYYKDYRNQKMIIDTKTGDTMEWRVDDEDRLKSFIQQNPQLTVITQEIPTIRLAIVVQGKVFFDGPQPLGIDQYPFVPVFAYYNPQLPYYPWRVQGVVRGLRDAQYLYNRRMVIAADILESQINSGWKYKENALVNPKDIFLQGQGKGLALKEEAAMTDVEQIQAPQIPPSMFQLQEIFAREVMEISGVNEELLGSAIDDKAGILSMLRQGAGLTTLQVLFDNLDYSQKLLYKIFLDYYQINFAPGKVEKILKEPASEEFYNKNFGKYDAVVEEGLNTATQRQMQFAQLLQLREVGVPVPDQVLLDAVTIQKKKELVDAISQQNEQQAQMQQQQAEADREETQARTQLAYARAQADSGLGLERMSRIEENQKLAEERSAQAVKDRQEGVLAMVKAMKELESIDLSQLEKLIQLTNMVKSMEPQPRENAVPEIAQQIQQPQPQEQMPQQQGMI